MALKFFKRSTDQLFIFPENNSTLSHGPLPVKANGAVVVHRPSHRLSQRGTIRSLPIYLQDEPIEDDIMVFKEKTTEETDIGDRLLTTDDFQSSSTSSSCSQSFIEEEEVDIVDLVHEENAKLSHQLVLERRQQEKISMELLNAKNTIKNLERTNARYHKLLFPLPVKEENTTLTYERKVKILLDEIEAMEELEQNITKELKRQQLECEELKRYFGSSFTPTQL